MKALSYAIGSAACWLLCISRVDAVDAPGLDPEGYIRDWIMLAPIALPERGLAADLILREQVRNEAALQPRDGDPITVNGQELTWKKVTASTNYFDFNALLKTQNDRAAGFMVTYVECEKEIPDVTMAVASNDQGRIYFNGVDIYAFTEARPLMLDADKGRVTLKKGVNVIVFKIINEQNAWQGSMRLLDKTGSPLKDLRMARSADSPTLKDAFRDDFAVGVAVNRSMVTGRSSFRRSADLVNQDIALVKAQFNQITAENDMKWQLIHPREGPDGYDFGPADAFVEFGLSNGMQLVGHTLVWHSQTPIWVFAGTNPPPAITNGTPDAAPASTASTATNGIARRRPGPGSGGFGRYNGPRASREELLQRMRDHIHTVVGRYKGRIKVWDVVNEAIADGGGTNVLRNSLWLEIIGPDFIAKAFQYAREADPHAILRYNDYGLENPVKRRKLITLIQSLREQGVPVHAIGSQAHVNVGTTFETMDQALTEMATLGLPIHITELDVNSAQGGQRGTGADVAAGASTTQGGLVDNADQRLADAYAGLFEAFLKHRDSVKMVTFWGANDAVSWRANGRPLLFDGDNRPKPAFDAVIVRRTVRPK